MIILNEPEACKQHQKYPKATMEFFNSFIPDKHMREYVLSFIKTKLTTLEHSPTILNFTGVQGSGKNTFFNILGRIVDCEDKVVGRHKVNKPRSPIFMSNYNAWMMGKYFTLLDGYGESLELEEQKEVVSKLKAYTGSKQVQIHCSDHPPYAYEHDITFITTAEARLLPLDADDKTTAVIHTPNKLEEEDWVISSGGLEHVMNLIESEHLNFCYYLATEVKTLSKARYKAPPHTAFKQDIIDRTYKGRTQ